MSIEEGQKKNEMKVILLVDSGVGKTNLINTSMGNNFDEESQTTTTATFSQKEIKIGKESYYLDLWDTAGQEKYQSVTKIFLKKSEIVVFVYDITDENSFNDLEKWIQLSEEMIDNDHVCGIVGNKGDLYSYEKVKEGVAREYAESKKMQFQLVSAKENPSLFNNFLKDLVMEHKGCTKSEFSENVVLKKENKLKKKEKCNC
jgi:small GTP-binding protein